MTQSVELLLDDATDAAVRHQWAQLEQAALPNQGRHTGATNAPHVTLAVADGLDDAQENELHGLADDVPFAVRLGGLVAFPRRSGSVLARLVVPSAVLLRVHARAARIVPPADPNLEPGRWTAHVTLARRLTAEQVGRAVGVLADTPDTGGTVVAVRRWDSSRKITWRLASRSDRHFG